MASFDHVADCPPNVLRYGYKIHMMVYILYYYESNMVWFLYRPTS